MLGLIHVLLYGVFQEGDLHHGALLPAASDGGGGGAEDSLQAGPVSW